MQLYEIVLCNGACHDRYGKSVEDILSYAAASFPNNEVAVIYNHALGDDLCEVYTWD
jgi:hypothetical protein